MVVRTIGAFCLHFASKMFSKMLTAMAWCQNGYAGRFCLAKCSNCAYILLAKSAAKMHSCTVNKVMMTVHFALLCILRCKMHLQHNCVAVFFAKFLPELSLSFYWCWTFCGAEHFGTFCCAKIDFCIKCIFASKM